ncbi:MAG: ABC transporter ATP-binding protein [Candidatus Omnitrophica bacterium]|nr:ABC transporter ATP-binding protein [Candidatus Omnitrophota bacterium]
MGILSVRNIWGGYTGIPVIKDFSLEVHKGEFLGIIGPNGSGKSTLLKLLSRILTPSRGSILLLGEDIRGMDQRAFARKTAFVSQDTHIYFPFSVMEITLMGRIPHLGRLQMETKRDIEIAEQALALTDVFSLKNKLIDELSSGERQRVIVSRALAQEPLLLFLDEPTAHLDIGHQIQILDLLHSLNLRNGLTIVMVLHDLNLAAEYCGRIILLNEGGIFKDGRPEEVLSYQNIEAVYKTVVVVNKNPFTGKPFVVPVSRERCRRL